MRYPCNIFIKSCEQVLITTNPHDKTKSNNLELGLTLTETQEKGSPSIYSTDSHRGVIVPILGNQSIGRIVRAGGTHDENFVLPLEK